MNSRFKECQECPVMLNCWIDGERDRMVKTYASDKNSQALASKISVMSQRAKNEYSCPNSEIQRVREEIAKLTGDTKAIRLAGNVFKAIGDRKFSDPGLHPSVPIGQQRSVRGDRKF